MKKTAPLIAALLAFGAQAQVVKCVDAKTGKTTYTNSACSGGETSKVIVRESTAEEIADREVASVYARERQQISAERESAALKGMAATAPPATGGMASLTGGSGSTTSAACRQAQHELSVVRNAKTFTRDAGPELRAMRQACGLPEPLPSSAKTRVISVPAPAAPPAPPQRECRMGDPTDFNCFRQ